MSNGFSKETQITSAHRHYFEIREARNGKPYLVFRQLRRDKPEEGQSIILFSEEIDGVVEFLVSYKKLIDEKSYFEEKNDKRDIEPHDNKALSDFLLDPFTADSEESREYLLAKGHDIDDTQGEEEMKGIIQSDFYWFAANKIKAEDAKLYKELRGADGLTEYQDKSETGKRERIVKRLEKKDPSFYQRLVRLFGR